MIASTMKSSYRTASAVTVAVGLLLAAQHASAAEKADVKCLKAVSKAIQTFTQKKLQALSKCRETPADPSTAQCPDDKAQSAIAKAYTKKVNTISGKCRDFDPSRALAYTGCPDIPGCTGSDVDPSATAAGYIDCTDCASTVAPDRLARTISDGACGNGHSDAGEECDDGNETPNDGCDARCLIESVCGNGTREPREECDGTVTPSGCEETYQCVTAGLTNECTCIPPCELDPVPNRSRFTTILPTGICGCTLSSADDTTCSASNKIGDLQCGALYLGGGLSAVPPGESPDGATTWAEFPLCGGSELLIGPSAGTGPKDCSFGADETEGPCYYGPALPVENDTRALSTCVRNTLKENLSGTVNPTTGHSTMRVELISRVFLTGDIINGTCRGGNGIGAPCDKSPRWKRGDGVYCAGGSNPGASCDNNADCPGGGTCIGICGVCRGGSNDGTSCQEDSDCTGGGTCNGICADQVIGECEGGSNDGQPCTRSACDGGLKMGVACTDDSNCTGGGTCKGICTGGSNPGDLCATSTDCTGGGACTHDSDCPGGTCKQVGLPVEPCPTCVDADFNPITDGSTGMCNLGANRGLTCESTNSKGLTVDCLPTGAPAVNPGDDEGDFLADIEVTIPAITTGTAEMIADEDGHFCDFGRCVGGDSAGLSCNNTWDCSGGGTCQKLCQGGDVKDGQACDILDDCIGNESSGTCGQRDRGAFKGSLADGSLLGGATVRRVIAQGVPADAPILIGETKTAKLGAVFCVPRTGSNDVDSAGSLPGPGATSLQGNFTLLRVP